VLSTLHTNDSPSAIVRLLDLGVPPFLISATVLGIMAQRLLRKICPHCRRERDLTRDERNFLQLGRKPQAVWEGEGCKECRDTGYRGRTGIFEVLEVSERIKGLVSGSAGLSALTAAAREEGMVSLRQVAINKMLEGVTTYEEVIAMTG
jgi:general secretion pathway protein E